MEIIAQTLDFAARILNLIKPFFDQPNLPNILQNISLGLITMSIAISVFLTQSESKHDLDKLLVVKRIIGGRTIGYFLVFLFLPLLFWDVLSPQRWMLFGLYSCGVYGICTVLRRAYLWITDFKVIDSNGMSGFRFNTLWKELLSSDDPTLWQATIDNAELPIPDEGRLVELLTQKIRTGYENRQFTYGLNFLILLTKNLSKFRFEYYSTYKHIYFTIFDLFAMTARLKQDSSSEERSFAHKVRSTLYDLFEIGINSDNGYNAISSLEMYYEKLQDNSAVSHKDADTALKFYLQVLLSEIFKSVSDDAQIEKIWKSVFSKKWRMTIDNYSDPYNRTMASLSVLTLTDWAKRQMFISQNKDSAASIYNHILGVFPDVAPYTFTVGLSAFAMHNMDTTEVSKTKEKQMQIALLVNSYIIGKPWREFEFEIDSQGDLIINREKMPVEIEFTIKVLKYIYAEPFESERLRNWIRKLENKFYTDEDMEKSKLIFQTVLGYFISDS